VNRDQGWGVGGPAGRRATLLAAWGSAWLAGTASLTEAVGAVTGRDEPHAVDWQGASGPLGLDQALGRLRLTGADRLRLALPLPGDPAGVPGGTPLEPAAIEVGAAVLAVPPGGPGVGLVPWVSEHGSALEGTAVVVRWAAHRVPAGPPAPGGPGLAEAEGTLREAVREAAGELVRLDVARWRPEVGEALEGLRSGSARSLPVVGLPPGYPYRAQHLVDLAARLSAVVDLALVDDGAAVAAVEVRERAAWLRTVATAARRAVVAAVNAAPVSSSPGP
jgi:hypothetical protein